MIRDEHSRELEQALALLADVDNFLETTFPSNRH